TVLDDERLPQALRQPLANQAPENVGRAAGRKTDDDAHRPGRIIERPCVACRNRERASARCQMQKSSTRKFHRNASTSVRRLARRRHNRCLCDRRKPAYPADSSARLTKRNPDYGKRKPGTIAVKNVRTAVGFRRCG